MGFSWKLIRESSPGGYPEKLWGEKGRSRPSECWNVPAWGGGGTGPHWDGPHPSGRELQPWHRAEKRHRRLRMELQEGFGQKSQDLGRIQVRELSWDSCPDRHEEVIKGKRS